MKRKEFTHISPSELNSFSDCKLQWYWQYVERLTPLGRSLAFDLGIGIHEALAAFYGEGRDPMRVFAEWVVEQRRATKRHMARLDGAVEGASVVFEDDLKTLDEARDLGVQMLKGYMEQWAAESFEVLAVEEFASIPIPGTDWTFICKVDALVRDNTKRGRVYVLEHKTFSRFSPDYLHQDHQFVGEAWAAAESLTDEPVRGVIYNGLRKQAPGPRTKLDLFERHYIDVSSKSIKVLRRRLRDTVERQTDPDLRIYPEPSPVKCSMCSFKVPCSMYMHGHDYKEYLEIMFTKRGSESAAFREELNG